MKLSLEDKLEKLADFLEVVGLDISISYDGMRYGFKFDDIDSGKSAELYSSKKLYPEIITKKYKEYQVYDY